MLPLILFLACPKPVAETGPPTPGPSPILPAPYAPVYTAAPGVAADPLVNWVAQSHRYDETLSGAAGALALMVPSTGELDGAAVHWALIQSGWPYGTAKAQVFPAKRDQIPAEVSAAIQKVPKSTPIGLARARQGDQETWVLLEASVTAEVRPFLREVGLGDSLTLRPTASGWSALEQRALPPQGPARTGSVQYDAPGEWLVELWGTKDGARQRLVQVPVYVGEVTPEDGPFLNVDASKPEGDLAIRAAERGIAELRGVLDAPPLEMDPVLLSLAGRHSKQLAMGEADAQAILQTTSEAGLTDAALMVCTGETVQGCLDHLFWSVSDREVLRNPSQTLLGVGADWTAGGLQIVVLVAR
ncbi:MAG: hypothetical protein VX899_21860 [Myxococcota bacterium]|nr:hypothetical protein [Myxococcota bacterium]